MTITGTLAATSMIILFIDKFIKCVKDFDKAANEVKKVV